MRRKRLQSVPLKVTVALFWLTPALAQTPFQAVPFTLQGGKPADMTQVMANFQSLVANGNSSLSLLNNALAAVAAPPTTMLMYFNLAACPTGWTQAAAAFNGYFLRGADNGRGLDPLGTPGMQETPQFQDHTHSGPGSVVVSVATANLNHSGGASNSFVTSTSCCSSGTGGMSSGTSGTETRPVNVALLLCQKN